MPAKCGALGPMICLNGAVCNETLGECSGCPAGFRDDETVFRGNRNCGLNEAAMYFIYSFSGIFSIFVCAAAFLSAMHRKASRLRKMFLLIGLWTGMVPFTVLAHYLDGMRYGIATTVLYVLTIMAVNVQVALLFSVFEGFMAVACNLPRKDDIQRKILYINIFWFSTKVVFGLVMLGGLIASRDDVFNAGQLALGISLMLEVTSNVIRVHFTSGRIIRSVQALHSDLTSTSVNPVVMEFAKRIQSQRWSMPAYAVIYFLVSLAQPILYVVFDSSIPYQVVLYAVVVMTWPMIGAVPVLALKTKLGKQMDKATSKNTVTDASGTVGIGPAGGGGVGHGKDAFGGASSSAQSPVTSANKKRVNNKSEATDEAIVVGAPM